MIKDRNIDPLANIDPTKILGGLGNPLRNQANVVYVDGDNGSDTVNGKTPGRAFKTIQAAVTAVGAWGRVYVFPKNIAATDTDPASYAETVIIPATHEGVQIIGVLTGRTQGGLPQIKIGAGSTAILTIRSAGCGIYNIGINGVSSTGGGIKLDDDGGTSKVAFGATIANCHFKNCAVSATNASSGGAITLAGAPWQVTIQGNQFFNNIGDIVHIPTYSDAKDVIIQDNIFSSTGSSDCNIYMTGSSGDATGLVIDSNIFRGFPAVGSGVNLRFAVLTGYTGILSNNSFASNDKTFKAAGSGALVPATMFMAGNYQESTDAVGTFGSLTGRSS